MYFQYISYVWLLLASAVIMAALGIYAWRHRTVPGAAPFAVLMLMAVVWSLANGLEMAGADLSTKIFWANIQYPCYVTIPVAWLALTLQYIGRDEWLTRRRLAWLSIEPLLTVALVWTNDLHGLLRRNVYLDIGGPFPVVGKTFGPWFWVHAVYTYLLLLVIICLYIKTLLRMPLLYRKQIVVLLLSFLLPLVWNLLYNFGLSPVPRHDLAPAVFSLAGVGVAWGLFRYRLFDIVPVARATVIESMDDGVIVLDAQNRVVDLNPAAHEVLDLPASQAVGQPATRVLSTWPDLIALCRDAAVTRIESVLGAGDAQHHYNLRASPLTDRHGHPTGRLIVLHDVTELKHSQAQLLAQRQTLAVLEDRGRLARELHDGLAQDLAALRLRLSRWRRLVKRDPAQLHVELDAAQNLLSENIRDVRRVIFALRPVALDKLGFYPALRQFAEDFEEQYQVHVDLRITGPRERLPRTMEVTIFRIVQETLHNAGKHARASGVWVELDLETDGAATLRVQDDGVGFNPALLEQAVRHGHMGLAQMRERVERLGGTFALCSRPGGGTEIQVTLPFGLAADVPSAA
jgi:PAS domain S-box-containing protein